MHTRMYFLNITISNVLSDCCLTWFRNVLKIKYSKLTLYFRKSRISYVSLKNSARASATLIQRISRRLKSRRQTERLVKKTRDANTLIAVLEHCLFWSTLSSPGTHLVMYGRSAKSRGCSSPSHQVTQPTSANLRQNPLNSVFSEKTSVKSLQFPTKLMYAGFVLNPPPFPKVFPHSHLSIHRADLLEFDHSVFVSHWWR